MKRLLGLLALVACVPPDNALSLGSVEVTLHASIVTRDGVPANVVADGWAIRFDRTLLSFKTMTIGEPSQGDTCSYRGSAEKKNVLLDLREGVVQSFNGMLPGLCGDMGAIFGPPDGATVPIGSVTPDELVTMAEEGTHLYVRAHASRGTKAYDIDLRFDTSRTSSKLAGCRSGFRGVRIDPNARTLATITFTGDQLFKDSLSQNASVRFAPFVFADFDGDHVITMDELDRLPLATLESIAPSYTLSAGNNGSFGDFVRAQVRYAWLYELGQCAGKAPGED